MKKYISLFICIVLCFSLIGCSTESESTEISSTSTTATSTFAAVADATTVSEATTAAATSSTTSTAATQKTTVSKAQTTTKSAAKPNTTEKKTTVTTTTTTSNVTCTVTIECKNILNKMDNLKAGHEAYVPESGVMLSSYSVTVKNGATVFDAVKQACGSNSISMNTTSSSYGYYIAGFNNIDEKDCGSASGWIYSVNGSMPNKSCSKYAVKSGDNIVFSYTC